MTELEQGMKINDKRCVDLRRTLLLGGEEGLILFTEEHPILDISLDTSGSCDSLWVATTATHINKWPVDPNKANGFCAGSEEEETKVTYIDDEPAPVFSKPIASIPGKVNNNNKQSPLMPSPGGSSIKEYCILSNRQQVLTKDSEGEVVLWDILHVSESSPLL